jgi:multiple sugar transport system permease protein
MATAQPKTAALPAEAIPGTERPAWLERLIRVITYAALILLALAMFVPFIYALSTSFKSLPEASQPGIAWIPAAPTTAAYERLFSAGFGRAAFNSFFVAFWVLAGRLLFNSMAGYALARLRFPGRNLLFGVIVASMFVPGVVLIVPRFLILSQLGMLNSYQGMIVPLMTDAFGIFLMRQFFESIPVELEEAAQIDGASRFGIFFRVILPLATPALATMAILSFQGAWNELIHYLVVTGTYPPLYTLTLWLAQLRGTGFQVDWPVIMAGSMLTTVPTAIVFLMFQRLFIEGVSYSGLAGQ